MALAISMENDDISREDSLRWRGDSPRRLPFTECRHAARERQLRWRDRNRDRRARPARFEPLHAAHLLLLVAGGCATAFTGPSAHSVDDQEWNIDVHCSQAL